MYVIKRIKKVIPIEHFDRDDFLYQSFFSIIPVFTCNS